MKTNRRAIAPHRTMEGAVSHTSQAPLDQLERTLMSCMLWEKGFYEEGKDIADRIVGSTARAVHDGYGLQVNNLMVTARRTHGLRHAPLLVADTLAELGALEGGSLSQLLDRPDQITELLSLHMTRQKKSKLRKLPSVYKRAINRSLNAFDAYQLAKYKQSNKAIKLRDVLFLTRPKPKDDAQQALFNQLAEDTLPTPDTWETNLSAGKDKRETFTRLIEEDKLGALAFIRNLRNMVEADVSMTLIREKLAAVRLDRIFPYQLLAAASGAPSLEREIEGLLARCVKENDQTLPGRTAIVLDRSGSMGVAVSTHSVMQNCHKAIALGMVAAEMCDDHDIWYFANHTENARSLRGFTIRDRYKQAPVGGGTDTHRVVKEVMDTGKYDRVIIITDEQSSSSIPSPHDKCKGRAYIMNIASYKNGIGHGDWETISGFSANIFRYIIAREKMADMLLEI